MMIIDTREQRPLWDVKEFDIISKKLNEGDYTTEKLEGIAHIERKSGIDLYGSIIQGHTRFRKEIQRAIEKNITLAIFVECPEEMFYRKLFQGGYRLKAPSMVLRKIIATLKDKYNLEFVWCADRDDLKSKMCQWFALEENKLK